jgi:PAS domain S-box-containing protein
MIEDVNDATIPSQVAGSREDIAEVRRQKTLLKTGALQNAILNSANFSSIATDEKGVIQIFNIGAERMLGYVAADVMNKITPAEIFDPQDVIARAEALSLELGTPIAPGFEALVFKASRGIEDIYELTYIRKDGSRFPAVVSVTALRDAQNAIIGFLLIGTDNTARKQIEAERQHLLEIQEETNKRLQQTNITLQISEEKLAVTLNSIGDAVITTDAKGCAALLNPLAERLTGWTQTEAAGRPVEDIFRIINKETRQPSTIPIITTLAHGTIQGLANHTVLIARDGSECDIADSCAPIRNRDGQVIGAVLVFRDVTGEYAIQQALRDQQFYTRSLIESNIDALMTTDPSGIITDINKQMEGLTGCTRDELIGAPFKNYFTDPERAEAAIKLVLSEKKITNYELTARSRDGQETVVSYNATTFYNRDGELQGVFAAARDVTDRKRLDQELESAKSVAEKANLAKSAFLSSMSHELRTPLNAILGFAQLLEAGSPPPTDAQFVRLRQIIKAGWYLLELINEILDLAVIESGNISLSREPVSLIDIVSECHAMIESQAHQRDIKMTFLPFDHTWFAYADRTRVKQVLINLLSNAIKYNREHGTVEVECIKSTPDRIRIIVRDIGAGLPPEKLAQLFQPFNRLGQEGGAEEGTGIGLMVTKRLVEMMGGAIGVESAVGKGSTFWFELISVAEPQLDAEGEDVTTLAHPPRGARLHTMLYVEDNPANLMLVEQIVEDIPRVRMLSARDGNQGIALARTHLPDMILMDINLPGINGIEVMKILRGYPTTMNIPIVALSANAMHRDIEKGLEAGFFRYLTKPIKINEFVNALNDALKFSEIGSDNTREPEKYDD